VSPERDSASVTLNAALAYARRGRPAFPVKEGKSPATRHGFNDATTDPRRIRELWREASEAGVAIATGAGSGLVVADVAAPRDGRRALKEAQLRAIGTLICAGNEARS
jgi:hypothetical protein